MLPPDMPEAAQPEPLRRFPRPLVQRQQILRLHLTAREPLSALDSLKPPLLRAPARPRNRRRIGAVWRRCSSNLDLATGHKVGGPTFSLSSQRSAVPGEMRTW